MRRLNRLIRQQQLTVTSQPLTLSLSKHVLSYAEGGGRGRTPLPRAVHPLWFDKLTMSGSGASPRTDDAMDNTSEPIDTRTLSIRRNMMRYASAEAIRG